jgi:hypothetical protein
MLADENVWFLEANRGHKDVFVKGLFFCSAALLGGTSWLCRTGIK